MCILQNPLKAIRLILQAAVDVIVTGSMYTDGPACLGVPSKFT